MPTRNQPQNINTKQRNRRIDSEDKLVNYIKTQLGSPLITVDVTEDQILQCIDDTFAKFVDWAYDAQQHQVFIIQVDSEISDYLLDDRIREIYDISIADGMTSYATSGSGISLGGFGTLPIGYIPYVNMEGQVSSLERNGFGSGGGMSSSATGVAGGVTGPSTGGGSRGDKFAMGYAALVDSQTMQNLYSQSVSYDFNAKNHILRIFDKISGPVVIEGALEYIPNPDYDDMYGHAWIKEYSLNLVKRVWGQNLGKYSQSLIGGTEINFDRIISEAQTEIERLNEELMSKYSEALGIFSA